MQLKEKHLKSRRNAGGFIIVAGHKTKNLKSTSQKDKEKGNVYTRKSFLISQGPGELSVWHQEASESLAVHSE